MRRLLSVLFSILICTLQFLSAQVISRNMPYVTSTVVVKVLDSTSRKPISYASVFLVPQKDSIISHFTLSDTTGVARINEVTKGEYLLNIQMMGYKPIQKSFYARRYIEDLGKFYLAIDEKMLKAATVTATANPITIKKDTIEYNAASFLPSKNAMLGDLLKRIPGIDVSNDGMVQVNGETVSKITVNGKTFFFDDKKTALNNLPARIIDKIRVIDKDSDASKFAGISDAQKEKVMDVALKEEYKKGWFGNTSASGGSTIEKKNSNNPLSDDRGALYSGTLLLAAYNEHNQLTAVGNIKNVNDIGSISYNPNRNGLQKSQKAAINLNSSVLKGMEIDGMVTANSSRSENKSQSARTSILSNTSHLYTHSISESGGKNDSFNTSFEIRNTNWDKYYLTINPTATISRSKYNSHSQSSTANDVSELGNSTSDSHSTSDSWNSGMMIGAGSAQLGKKGRSISLNASLNFSGNDGKQYSLSQYSQSKNSKDLFYDSNDNRQQLFASIRYAEPITEKWILSTEISSNYSGGNSRKDAFDPDTTGRYVKANDYYSSVSNNKTWSNEGSLLIMWHLEDSQVQVGTVLKALSNETYSGTYGVSTTTGKNEWVWNWSPHLSFSRYKDGRGISAYYSMQSNLPSKERMLPVLDISNLSYLNIGNIYLKPEFGHSLNFNFNGGNRKKFKTYYLNLSARSSNKRIVSASWFDSKGVRYSIPVNSKNPSINISAYGTYNIPLDKDKRSFVAINLNHSFDRSISYQASGTAPSVNIDNFDYGQFMSSFWGLNESGEIFYSGKSGFKESATNSFRSSGDLTFSYRDKDNKFSARAGYGVRNVVTLYTFNSRANVHTWDHNITLNLQYVTPHDFEISTFCKHTILKGYSYGFGDPQWCWNMEISKDIKAFTLSLSAYDILNDTKSLNHQVAENYYEDTYSLILGRYILAGIKWNFGKMNARNAAKANNALFQTTY